MDTGYKTTYERVHTDIDCYEFSSIGTKYTLDDKIAVLPEKGVLLQADGISKRNGKAASDAAVSAAIGVLNSRERIMDFKTLRAAFNAAQKAVSSLPVSSGTTLDIAVVRYESAIFCHVGDSRIYHFSNTAFASRRKARQVTRDHNDGFYIENFIGHCQMFVDTGTLHLLDGDVILMCTDGVHNRVDQLIKETMTKSHLTPEAMGTKIISEVQELERVLENSDNYSLIIYKHKRRKAVNTE